MALPPPPPATLEPEPEPEPAEPLRQQRLQVRGGLAGGGAERAGARSGERRAGRRVSGEPRGCRDPTDAVPQEPTPAGPAAPPRSPPRAARRAGPELRVLLTPLRAGRRLPQRRLLGRKRRRAGRPPEPPPEAGPGSPADSGPGGDRDSDGSDAGDAARDGYSQLSAYERKRLKNITENAKFFAALKLHESAARLHQIASRRQSHVTKRAKPKKAEDEPVRRRSMRLQRVEPSGTPVPEPEAEELPRVPAGPVPMVPEDQESSKLTQELLATWTRISEMKANGTEKLTCDMKRYQDSLSSMVLSEENIRKVVKYRVCSMAIHPSQSIVLVAAGDKSGQVGLWNVICRSEDDDFSSFDFLDDNASTAVVGHWAGDVAVVDRRTPGTSPELSADIGFKRTRTVHVHPVNKQYFMAAGSVDVCIYDVRYLKSKGNKPLSSLKGHTKSVASAYFSPVTGNRVVTVCADDKLRVYDTSSLSSTLAALSTVSHNCNTGRWLTRFRAVWDPKQERCFAVGSMARPRQVQLFRDTGALLHAFHNPDCLGSVCSINVLHPSRNILVGGNSSGRLHVFKD
ncbi:WD repeat-containing protein 76 isoform X2 [Caloenas nicobarica]|uniref:WD repeat-containing protein 76 isoform X2 n=1 Tax=Caloenas nicobarica TaxID=187106 RepID=UPI0032B72DD3